MCNEIKACNTAENIAETKDGIFFFNAKLDIFTLGGIKHPDQNNNEYYRLDAFKKDTYSDLNRDLAKHTSGATLRFVTDADYFILKVKMNAPSVGMLHFAARGAYGFDVYTGSGTNRTYCGGCMQMMTNPEGFEEKIILPKGETEVSVNLPLYGGISEMLMGIPDGAIIKKAPKRAFAPIAFYGSSITQGGCVSRPGNMYSNIICREIDADCLNLGFSGSALGEQSVAEYLATREISCFVMDYDFNALSLEHLEQTHLPFYETVRKAHPDTPIVIVTHPYYGPESQGDIDRKNILCATYNMAMDRGDKVYFVDSETFFPLEMRDLFAVDNLHPNSLGQYFMYKAICPTVKKALGIE